jgi:hypothetical protein
MNKKSKRLFLIDGLGALTTAGLLFFLLAEFEYLFGMPKQILHGLSLMAILFSAYSFSCLIMVKQNWKFFLSLIAFANITYCLLTTGLMLYHYSQLTQLGLMYFVGEIAIIIMLVYFELKTIVKS